MVLVAVSSERVVPDVGMVLHKGIESLLHVGGCKAVYGAGINANEIEHRFKLEAVEDVFHNPVCIRGAPMWSP